jgi:uncharacterized protein YndB with AHSA1/START domain
LSLQLIVQNAITIDASLDKVWDVLIKPKYIKQWDDLPEDFDISSDLKNGSEIVWEMEEGEYSKLSVIAFKPLHLLKLALIVSKWEQPPAPEDVAYTYTLFNQDDRIRLSIQIGDFAKIASGKKYYDASIEFAQEALQKIKELAEQ